MTRHLPSPELRYLQGFSLIELMISLALGLIILVAVLSAYTGAAAAAKMAEAQGRMYEDGQAALTILTQQLRMAGYNPYQAGRINTHDQNPVYTEPPDFVRADVVIPAGSGFQRSDYSIRGCDQTFITDAGTSLDDLGCVANVSAQPDSIALSYEADVFNTVPTVARTSPPTDCLGFPLTNIVATVRGIPAGSGPNNFVATSTELEQDVSFSVAVNRFYIALSDTTSIPSLYCQGNGAGSGSTSTAQPLVENIQDMQITYGVEIPVNQTRTVAGYLRAEELNGGVGAASAHADLKVITQQERWRKVVSVRICLLVRSESAVVSDLASAQYFDCAGELVGASDLRLRRTFSSTVMLRNWLGIEVTSP